jgi:hypothetical protein
MSASGYTPILIYASGTAAATPSTANLTTSATTGAELAINYTDGKLFYKDAPSGSIQVLATKGTGTIGGSTTQVQYNSSGALAGSANLTFDGTILTANTIGSSRINPRTSSTASTATLTPDISAYDQYNLTAQAATLTVAAPIGTPVDGNKLIIRILDNGTTRTISWNATYTAIGVTLPTATTANKMVYVGCIYNSTNTRWDVVAVSTQA